MTQSRHDSFGSLIDLAQSSVDEASAQLARLIADLNGAEQQLATLKQYRLDYSERLNHALQNGMTASNYHNFTRFLGTLDDAIVQQTSVMTHLEDHIDVCQEHWRNQRQRLNSYETLQTRQEQQHALTTRRHEQRLNDELCITIHRRTSSERKAW